MAFPSYTYIFVNGTTSDATQVNQNFTDILNGITDGSKDLSIAALTCAGTATLNGNVNLGNSAADDLSITGSLASSLPIKTNASFDIGSATLGLRKLYLGGGGVGLTCDIVAASHATTREYTIPDCSAAANFVMSEATATINGVKTFAGQLIGKGTASNDSAASGYIGEILTQSRVRSAAVVIATGTSGNVTGTALALTAGDWELGGSIAFTPQASTSITQLVASVSTTSSTVSGSDTTAVGDSGGQMRTVWSASAQVPGANDITLVIPNHRVSIATITTFYLVQLSTTTINSMSAYGSIYGRRVR